MTQRATTTTPQPQPQPRCRLTQRVLSESAYHWCWQAQQWEEELRQAAATRIQVHSLACFFFKIMRGSTRSLAEQAEFEALRDFQLAMKVAEHEKVNLVEAMTRIRIAERRAARCVPFHNTTHAQGHSAADAATSSNSGAVKSKRKKRASKAAPPVPETALSPPSEPPGCHSDSLEPPPATLPAEDTDSVLLLPPAPEQQPPPIN